jgi:hypothetical protein
MDICRMLYGWNSQRPSFDTSLQRWGCLTDSQHAAVCALVIASPGNVCIDADRNNFPDPNSG